MGEKRTLKLGSLTIESVEDDRGINFVFQGDIDETFSKDIITFANSKPIVIDLAGIDKFNSCGIREWISFVEKAQDGRKITFKRCSVTMVDQINMVPHCLGQAQIESIYGPYYRNCECYDEAEVTCLIELDEHLPELEQGLSPEFSCQICKKPFDFDALEESYFLFFQKPEEKSA